MHKCKYDFGLHRFTLKSFKIAADDILKYFFLFYWKKNNIWYFMQNVCSQTILMKCHPYFLRKIKNKFWMLTAAVEIEVYIF